MGIFKKIGRYIFHYLFISAVFTLSISVLAEELDAVNTEALNKTIELLNSSSQRQTVTDTSPEAAKADNMAKELMGSPQNVDKLYNAAGEIFRKLAQDNNGEVAKMVEALQNAQGNPEAFYQSMTPEQKEMIRKLGESANQQRQLNNNQ